MLVRKLQLIFWMVGPEAFHKVKAVKKARKRIRKAKKAVSFWKTLSAKPDELKDNNGRALGLAPPLLVNSADGFNLILFRKIHRSIRT